MTFPYNNDFIHHGNWDWEKYIIYIYYYDKNKQVYNTNIFKYLSNSKYTYIANVFYLVWGIVYNSNVYLYDKTTYNENC